MNIDSHQHFWNHDPVEFDWIDDEMKAIRRDFLPQDLLMTIRDSTIDGVISVQARQNLAETEWLLKLAADHDFILGVVGWLPLMDPGLVEILDSYQGSEWLKGVRHVVQSEPEGFLDLDSFNKGIRKLTARNLVYDILVLEHQLEEVIRFVDRHPNQRFVLDHAAKPRIREGSIKEWRKGITSLALRDNVTCKVSGMVTEANYQTWTESDLQPYLETVMEAFGPSRLMFGSDWPVCLVATNYAHWLSIFKNWIAPLSAQDQAEMLGGTSRRTYSLEPSKE